MGFLTFITNGMFGSCSRTMFVKATMTKCSYPRSLMQDGLAWPVLAVERRLDAPVDNLEWQASEENV
jgi:hypothetical protein